VKAYNLDSNYVVLDDKDFYESHSCPGKSKIIEINAFIAKKEVDSIYSNAYFLEPEKADPCYMMHLKKVVRQDLEVLVVHPL